MTLPTSVNTGPISKPSSKAGAILQLAILRFQSEWSFKLNSRKKFKYYVSSHKKPYLGFSFTEIKRESSRCTLRFEQRDNLSGQTYVTLTGLGKIVRLVVQVQWSEEPIINDIFTSILNEIEDEINMEPFKIILMEFDKTVKD